MNDSTPEATHLVPPTNLVHKKEFLELSKKSQEAGETFLRFYKNGPEVAKAMDDWLMVGFTAPGIQRTRKFIETVLSYPSTVYVPDGIFGTIAGGGEFTLDYNCFPGGNFYGGSILIKECIQLFYELEEFYGGFYIHQYIYGFDQIQEALRVCQASVDPDKAWSEAIQAQYMKDE